MLGICQERRLADCVYLQRAKLRCGGFARSCKAISNPKHQKIEMQYGHPWLRILSQNCYQHFLEPPWIVGGSLSLVLHKPYSTTLHMPPAYYRPPRTASSRGPCRPFLEAQRQQTNIYIYIYIWNIYKLRSMKKPAMLWLNKHPRRWGFCKIRIHSRCRCARHLARFLQTAARNIINEDDEDLDHFVSMI